MKRILIFLMGMVLLTVPSLIYAEEDYYKSEVDISYDSYIYFGNEEYPRSIEYGINITVDESSISSQWVNIEVITEENIIDERKIYKFVILANGKVIETFYPALYTNEIGEIVYRQYYNIKPAITELIGTNVNFQVVGIQKDDSTNMDCVVAWSNISDTYRFDPLPVNDEEAVGWLEAIYYKLQEMLAKLGDLQLLLQNIKDLIENLFTPSPEALERFENARDNLFKSTPIEELQNEMENIKNTIEQSKNNLHSPVNEYTEQIVFGEKRDWFNIGKEMYLIDLNAFKTQIIMFREFLSAVLWTEFLFMLVFYLLPKLDI